MKTLKNSPKLARAVLIMSALAVVLSSFNEKETDDVSRPTILFNGRPLNIPEILLDAQGRLTMEAYSSANESRKIPFRVYLKRGSKVINRATTDNLQIEEGMAIREVLAEARKGDELTIEPTLGDPEIGRRTIKVGGYTEFHWFPIPGSFPTPGQPGGGC